MPNKIIILPDSVVNKIAAGEVIQRPASVLKELIENSLDAGADRITIVVEGAGIKLISVTDNGCGMSPDDALLCIEPHATSKISSVEDLNTIQTFGFRGEALPSIASVSKFHLRTKTHDSKEGTEIFVNGGKVIESKPAGCSNGTEITIKELFFNVPARRKFLSSPQIEEKHIIELLYTIGIANPTVFFEYHCDNKLIFSSPESNNLQARITEFFGKNYFENLIPIEYDEGGIEIQGFTAKHGFYRTSRREQRIYVNKRPAESNAIFAGIKDAYSSLLPPGKYPPVILFIKTNPIRVDVNVHPAKMEVKFREPLLFRNAVEKAIREALRISQSPSVNINTTLPLKQLLDASSISYTPKEERTQTQNNFLPGLHNIPLEQQKPELKFENKKFPNLKILGTLMNTYILAESTEGLLIIDQHAAHERIMFELLIANLNNSTNPQIQKLLIPITIEFSGAEIEFIKKNIQQFEALGFELESFGGNTLIVHSIPQVFPQENLSTFLHSIIDNLTSEGLQKPTYIDIAKKACACAIKANDKLQLTEIENLIQMLSKCEMPFCCPHGRPTIINISLNELKKRFGRIN